MNLENRTVEVDEIELRAAGDDSQRYASGIGVVYNREVEIIPGFRETIRNGAFTDWLGESREIKSYFNHDPSQVLSTTRSDPPLELEDTSSGLRFKSPIPPTSYGNDLIENLRRKNVRGASFSFNVPEGGEVLTVDEKGVMHREIVKAQVYEVGPVTNPAYKQTTANLRSAESVYAECVKRLEEGRAKKETEERTTRSAFGLRKSITLTKGCSK